MNFIKIIDGYSYSCDCNIIINDEIKSLDFNSEKIVFKNIKINSDIISKSLKNISQITFEVTQNCNLRCKYCINGGHYFFERKISKQDMKFEIAKKGLEFFFENIKNRMNKSFSIGFYGGEPLLAMDIIKKIVAYSKELFQDWELRYTMTTNGTTITAEIIDFLIENSFSIFVSLDGPKKIHDKKRIFANNDGSYEKIMENLVKIKKANKKYFKEKVRLNVVFSKDLPIIDRINFFIKTPLLKDLYATGSFVNYLDNDYYRINSYDDDRYLHEISTVKNNIKSKLLKQKKLKSIEIFFEKMLKVSGLNQKIFSNLGVACVLAKPLIDVNGNIHFCDKINDKFSFGNVFQGVDFRKLEKIIESFIDVNKQFCSRCDFRFLCNRCYIHFGKNGVFKFDKEYCTKQNGIILDRLKEYVTFNVDYIKTKNKTNDVGKRYKFHQFVIVERGPVNSAIINLLNGDIFHVENHYIEQFESNQQSTVNEFIKLLKEAQLIIEVDQNTWIPKQENNTFLSEMKKRIHGNYFELEIEDGLDFELIKKKFDMSSIYKLTYYGNKKNDGIFCSVPISYKEKNFNACLALSIINENFKKITKEFYFSNMNHNSCWAKKIAVTKDGKIRLCIYSNIVIGNIYDDEDIQSVVKKALKYWDINKDKVEKCKNCELRYTCFDCREIAQRKSNGNLYAKNPYCNYDPFKGKWIKE